SLPARILGPQEEKAILEAAERDLLTQYGLRSLAPSDPKYTGGYSGDRRARDHAYHNGIVWSWLIGPYLDACARVRGREKAASHIKPLKEFVSQNGMGTVPELFEPESLEPRGCFSQAWGVAEWLRVMAEYTE
ncbi:MAG: amylo-alpha-1,6-glucosidase, partial [Candidatus Micrarchaeota archaeon]